jgi:protein involved in polysaccharide export with SLBB domain
MKQFVHSLRPSVIFLALLLGGAGATLAEDSNAPAAGVSTRFRETNALSHLLEPHDSVSFRIAEDQVDPQEPAEPKILTVGDSGGVQVPYIGLVPVVGKTCQQVAEGIKQELEEKYYYKATVLLSLEMKAKSQGSCYVSGQVRLTGALALSSDEALTLSQAVVRAGGFTDYADKRKVRLTRRGESGTRTQIVDLIQVIEEGKADKDIILEPGDSVFIPSKLLSF